MGLQLSISLQITHLRFPLLFLLYQVHSTLIHLLYQKEHRLLSMMDLGLCMVLSLPQLCGQATRFPHLENRNKKNYPIGFCETKYPHGCERPQHLVPTDLRSTHKSQPVSISLSLWHHSKKITLLFPTLRCVEKISAILSHVTDAWPREQNCCPIFIIGPKKQKGEISF